MNLRNIVFINIWLLCSLAANAQFQDSLMLENLLQVARERSLAARTARRDLSRTTLNYQLFESTLKPQLTLLGNLPNYTKTFAEIVQPNGSIFFQPVTYNNASAGLTLEQVVARTGGTVFVQSDLRRFDDFENQENRYNGVPIRVGIDQPLFVFNPFKWEKKLQPLRLKAAQKQYNAAIEWVSSDVVPLFFNLLAAQKELEIAIANRSSNRQLVEIAQEKRALGKISESDWKLLELERISAQRAEKRAVQMVSDASADLYAYLGFEFLGETLRPAFPAPFSLLNIDEKTAIEQAQANRFELESFVLQDLEAQRDVDNAHRSGGFQANLRASFGLVRGAEQLGEIYANPQQEQFLQVQFTVPILDWGKQKNTVRLAEEQQDFVKESAKLFRIQLETEVKKVVRQFNSLQQELELVEQIKRTAQERFEIATQSYVLGAINIVDLTLAQREQEAANRAYVSLLTDYWSAYYRLCRLTLYNFEKQEKIEH